MDQHFENLEIILKELRKYNLKINLEKSEFVCKEVEYLGMIVSEHGISIGNHKINAIKHYPLPCNKKSVQQFLELASYFRRFISNFAT